MKTIVSLMFVFFVTLAMAIPAEAQNRRYGGYGSYGYGQRRPLPGGWGGGSYGHGYYDPSYLQQMMSLPDGLVACRVDLSTMKVPECHPLIKDIGIVEAHARDHADRSELLGTFHFEKGKPHFHAFDDTNRRLGTFGAGALGAGGGYIATAGTRNGWVRGGATVGGGLLAGWLASRKNHNNCLIIEPTVARSGNLSPDTSAQNIEQESVQSVADQRPIEVKRIVRNNFVYEGQKVRVRDGSRIIAELKPSGDEQEITIDPNSNIWFELYSENEKNQKWEWNEIREGKGVYELSSHSGWVFGDPKHRPSL